MKNWDKYRRMQCNIDKAICNQTVTELLEQQYSLIHSNLVKSEEDESIFNDTYLKLTYNYNPEKPFSKQFCYYFNLLKGAYKRDSSSSSFFPLDEERITDYSPMV